jgi:hypothetical protein
MSSFAYSSDPVVAGATEIQATTFNIVATDYVAAQANVVARFKAAHPSLRGLPDVSKGIPPEWAFYFRKDLTAQNSGFRNMIGVRVTRQSQSTSGFSTTIGKTVAIAATIYRVEVFNWYPVKVTLTDTTALLYWLTATASQEVIVDPETQVLAGTGNGHRLFTEAAGFLFTQVAANPPNQDPLMNLIGGIGPV